MAMQFVLTIDLPRVSVDRVASRAVSESAHVAAHAWPLDVDAAHQPSVRASWQVADGQLQMVWAGR